MALTAAYGGARWTERAASMREDMTLADVAVVWPRRTPYRIVQMLRKRGFRFIEVQEEQEAQQCLPITFVALAPGTVLMPSGGRALPTAYEEAGVICHTVEVGELIMAGGGIHCLTGCLKRDNL